MVAGRTDLRIIPGVPSGACAMLTQAKFHLGELCRGCGYPIKEEDGDVWFCDRYWLGTRKHGVWHYNCLK